jgi:glutamate synthase (ferredoxin)
MFICTGIIIMGCCVWLFVCVHGGCRQVTNPPIDSLREGEVMSLATALGRRGHVLNAAADDSSSTQLAVFESPVLGGPDLQALKHLPTLRTETVTTLYPRPAAAGRGAGAGVGVAEGDAAGLGAALKALTLRVVELVGSGCDVVILSDLNPTLKGLDRDTLYIPPLVAVGACHHALIAEGLRMRASLVVETGQCWTTHHVACLVGYGASAVHPYLALDAVRAWHASKHTQASLSSGKLPASLDEAAVRERGRPGGRRKRKGKNVCVVVVVVFSSFIDKKNIYVKLIHQVVK